MPQKHTIKGDSVDTTITSHLEVAKIIKESKGFKESDPALIVRAANEHGSLTASIDTCPGTVARFGRGFTSYPITWWAANIQLAALSGALGAKQKPPAQIRQNTLARILYTAQQNKPKTAQVIKFFGKHKITNDTASVIGRVTGGVFTNWAMFKGRGLRGSGVNPALKGAGSVGNLVLTSYGAAILGIAKGARRLEEILGMILTGDHRINTCVNIESFRYIPTGSASFDKAAFAADFDLVAAVDHLNKIHSQNLIPVSEFRY